MNNPTIIALVLTILVTGCAQEPLRKPIAPPTAVPIESAANVRVGEVVKAYPINRYIDPASGRMMHERHIVYRVEEDARWRLASNSQQQILIGNTFTASKLERQTAALRQEAAAASNRAGEINDKIAMLQKALLNNSLEMEQQAKRLRELQKQERDRVAKEAENASKPPTAPKPSPTTQNAPQSPSAAGKRVSESVDVMVSDGVLDPNEAEAIKQNIRNTYEPVNAPDGPGSSPSPSR